MEGIRARVVLGGLLLSWAGCGHAELFERDEPLELVLSGAVADLIRDNGKQRDAWPFRLRLPDGSMVDVGLKVRGNFRREHCAFPPLRVNFKRSLVRDTVFDGQDKLKLVTHCARNKRRQTDVLQEFAAYRLFNLVTPISFRVRLVRMTYADTKRTRDAPVERWAFFIEEPELLSRRVGGVHVEPAFALRERLNPVHTMQVALFQYLIGNTDFSPVAAMPDRPCCHNTKLIQIDDALYAVPYDFDMSGLVNAPYAGPNPIVQQQNVRRRVYLGHCTTPIAAREAVASLRHLPAQAQQLIRAVPGLPSGQAERDLRYLEDFFTLLENDAVAHFAKLCRT